MITNQKFVILVLSPENYVHNQAFQEISETLLAGLSALGISAVVTQEPLEAHRHIVLGSHLLFANKIANIEIPEDSILYNLEQIDLSSWWVNASLVLHFRHFTVWDYSLRNIEVLQQLGLNHVAQLPISYTPALTRIPSSEIEPDIDILFYGSLNERREYILHSLEQRGFQVKTLFGVYGEQRDRWIRRAKIVLNLHYYSSKVFESVRVSYLLANKKFVVSELDVHDSETQYFQEGVVFASYDKLVETCVDWLQRSPTERDAIAQKGYELICERPIEAGLAPLLENLPPASSKTMFRDKLRVDMGCGARKAPGYFGVDICPAPGVDRVANLTGIFPFPDNSVDELRAHDVIEHLPDRLHTMNEIWRVCKPGGLVDLLVPSSDGRGAFQDPTHVSFWNLNSFQYFSVDAPGYLQLCQQYGFHGAFKILALKEYQSPDSVTHVHAILEAIKSPEFDSVSSLSVRLSAKLRRFNFVLFLDWSQSEAALFDSLRSVLKSLFLTAARRDTTLLIDVSQIDDGVEHVQPEELIYSVCMDLALSENIDINEEEPLLVLISLSDYIEWDVIRPRLAARLQCDCDNLAILPVLQIEDLAIVTPHDKNCFQDWFEGTQFIQVWLKDQVHDARIEIGDYSYADGGVDFVLSNPDEKIMIGKFCSIAPRVSIFGGGEHFTDRTTTFPLRALFLPQQNLSRNHDAKSKGDTKIGNDVWIGQGATILSGVQVADGAVIGAESVVTRNVPPYAIVAGNPAQVIRYRFEPNVIQKLLELKWWDWDIDKIKAYIDALYQSPDRLLS